MGCAGALAFPAIGAAQDADAQQEAEIVQEQAAEKEGKATILQRLILGAGQAKVAIDTPQAVTVVEQEDMDRDQPSTIGDVLKGIPGVNTSGSERMFGQTFNIRGIGAPESAAEEGRVIVNVDGAIKYYEQYRMGGFFSDPELYKRVEVLRGPASSTLYGSGALGGVINFTTKDASDFIAEGQTGALKLKGTYNSNQHGYLGSVIFAQRFNEYVDLLVSGNYRESDPYLTGNGTEIKSSDFETWSGLAKLTFYDGYEGRLRLSYQHWNSEADDQDYAQVGGPLSDNTVSGFGTVDRHVVDRTAIVSYENPFSDNDWLDLKLQVSFSDTTVNQTDASGIPPVLTCEGSVFPPFPPYTLFCDTEYGYQTIQAKAENTIDYTGSNFENFFTYGYQFAHQTRTATVTTATGSGVGLGNHPEGEDYKNAFYIQDEITFNERFTLIPGIRWEWRELVPGDMSGVEGNENGFAMSPKLATYYRFNENFAIFGSWAHTERFPTLDEVFSTTGSGSIFLPSYGLKKEQADNIEAGFAISAYDMFAPQDSFQLKTTAFHNDIKDLIAFNPAISGGSPFGPPVFYPLPGYVNINNAQIYGVEVEAAYDSEFVFVNAAYSHIVGKNSDTNQYLTTVAPDELALTLGGRAPQYDLEFGWKARFVADPQDPCRVSDISVTCDGGASSRYSEAFNTHDVFLTWAPEAGAWQGWEARFGVDNVFDTEYKEFLMNDPAPGRTFKVTLAKTLGW